MVLSLLSLPSAFANHRTGDFALPEVLISGDFNGDGKLDLAVNVTGFDMAAIFLGNGQGGFTLKEHVALDTLPKGLVTGDINRDGKLDLVSCTAWGYDVNVYLGDGSGGFNATKEYSGDGEPVRLVLVDFNKDGALDIAVNSPDSGKIQFYFGDGKGGFVVPPLEVTGYPKPFGMAAGDFNGDSNPDLAFTFRNGRDVNGQVAVLLGDGQGGFTQSATFFVEQLPTSVQTGDMNNDGILDLVVAGAEPRNTGGNFVSTYLGDGAGHFTLKQDNNLGSGNLKGEIALGDFNEDGKLDVAFPQTGLNNGESSHSRNLLIFFGDGTGKLVQQPTITVGEEPHSVIAADFNKDGHLDLADTNRTDATVSVLLGDGQGHFAISSTFSVIAP